MKRPYELTSIFRQPGPLHVSTMLTELHSIRQELKECSPLLDEWLLKGNTKDEAYRYEVFDSTGPTTAAVAVLTESLKTTADPKIVSMWNGKDGPEGASLQYVGRVAPETSMIVLRAKPGAFSTSTEPVLRLVLKNVNLRTPSVVTLETAGYFDKKIFKDRPGVGWMLYLPRTLNAQQVPEARALVPVVGTDASGKDTQLGTIIVSVTDEPFSDENPEHVKVANAIEIRLVDQDLLPRFADL
ncbi:immunity 52 family protein [Herbaspirillum seropedicae]|uniref:immunity 52 family protein n=1 Tax=Herbaspirillum seropedicae TaxID=964 RepID=UPI003D973FDC